jgi:universal stress protein E
MVRLIRILFRTGRTNWTPIALQRVAELAWRTRASLTVAGVAPVSADDSPSCEQNVEALVSPLRQYGLEADTRILRGHPIRTVCEEVALGGYDLLALPFESSGSWREKLTGPEGARLARVCPSAVWNIKYPGRRRGRILAAIDSAAQDTGKRELCAKVLDWAATLAQVEDSELHVVNAWSVYGEWILRSRIRRDEFSRYVKETRSTAENSFRRMMGRLAPSVFNRHTHFVKGDPEIVVPALAAKIGADLVVMGIEGRTGIRALLPSNTAEKVLHFADCSVFTVRRDPIHRPIGDPTRLREPIAPAHDRVL